LLLAVLRPAVLRLAGGNRKVARRPGVGPLEEAACLPPKLNWTHREVSVVAYVSLYRKWRPQTFADVIGQAHVVRTLSNALTEKRIAHAYLFTGPRGTGKTTIARLLAKGLNCVAGPTADPCGECASCRRIAEGMAM